MHNPTISHFLAAQNNSNLTHKFTTEDVYALWSAYAAKRPLIVRGEPGTGKSKMAQAIAKHLNWGFCKEVINSNSELSDLHWHYDAVARLGESQVLGAALNLSDLKNNKAEAAAQKDKTDIIEDNLNRLLPNRFLSPGAFWWAYNWTHASKQYAQCNTKWRAKPEEPKSTRTDPWEPEKGGVVLLIDEIDKADPDLPNGLLETLGDRKFPVPYLSSGEQQGMIECTENKDLLVVITTNEERELPHAFLRRCLSHTIKVEESQAQVNWKEETLAARERWLIERAELHFKQNEKDNESIIADEAYRKAAKLVWDERKNKTGYKPGLAEYIDLLRAISGLPKDEQVETMNTISRYVLKSEQ